MVSKAEHPKCKISIVTPSRNQAEFIEQTLRSVREQIVGGAVEHIVVDGASTDGTLEILEGHRGEIKFISEPDQGMGDALNKGFGMATGDIIGWLNTDDKYLPGALQKAVSYFERNPHCLWLYGNCRIVDAHDREIRKWITAYKNRSSRKFRFERLLIENFISQPAVFMRRKALEAVGLIDPALPTAMDYDLWLRLAQLGSPGHIDDDLACFRVHHQSISSMNYKNQFDEQYRIHRRYDQDRWRLLQHRVKISLIVFIYGLLEKGQSLFRGRK